MQRVSHSLTQTSPSDDEEMLLLLNHIDAAKKLWAVIIDMINDESLRMMQERDGDLEIEGMRWYVGRTKSYKRRRPNDDIMTAISFALLRADDHKTKTSHYLSSAAWKAGECKKLLGNELFDKLFETRVSEHVQVLQRKDDL
jgi:hypothetical protein